MRSKLRTYAVVSYLVILMVHVVFFAPPMLDAKVYQYLPLWDSRLDFDMYTMIRNLTYLTITFGILYWLTLRLRKTD